MAAHGQRENEVSQKQHDEDDEERRSEETATSGENQHDDSDEDSLGAAAVHPTRDALQEGLLGLLRPTVDALEGKVSDTRRAQAELKAQIEALTADLDAVQNSNQQDQLRREVEEAVEKLNSAKKRVLVVANLLQGAQVRT